MKNKVKTYVLLIGVLIIWGVIAYRISTTINPSTPMAGEKKVKTSFTPGIFKNRDTFSIQTATRDPFLGTLYKRPVKNLKIIQVVKPKIIWPTIVYNGMISSGDGEEKIFVISINSIQHLMKKSAVADSIELIRGDKKKILMKYKNQRKTFEKL